MPTSRSRPADTEQVYVRTNTERMVLEKRSIAREPQRNGLTPILCRPQDLTVNAINRYLEIKARGQL
ncbi:MAG: hypothetical protein IPL52_03250 [Flavobacteriales bacterium]|nr:hypothetical protein [Flavobacteriales bacterium]